MKKRGANNIQRLSYVSYLSRAIDCIRRDWVTSIILIFSFVLYIIVIVPSGSRYCFNGQCGVYFWGAHEHDALWHLALIESAFRTIPFRFPIYAGQSLWGYNYVLDIILHVFSFSGLSASFLYFKVQPIAWFIVFTFLLYRLSQKINPEKTLFQLLSFFVFLGSSFGFIILWAKQGTLMGSSGTPTMQGALGMTNPQFMWSLCVVLGLWILIKSYSNAYGLIGLLVFLGISLKFYAVIPLFVLVGSFVVELIMKKEWKKVAYVVIFSLSGVLCAYLLFYKGGGGTSNGFLWSPLTLVHQIIEDKNMWHNEDMVNQRYFLIQAGNMLSPRLWWIEIKTIFLFIFFNYGIRLVALTLLPIVFVLNKNTRLLVKEYAILLAIILLSSLAPIVLIQKGIWWNTVQFLYYGLFAGSILTALLLWNLTTNVRREFQIIFLAGCFLLFIPSYYDIFASFTTTYGVHYIADEEIIALQHLKSLSDGIVLTQPFEKRDTKQLPDVYDTAYVSAYSGKQTYFANDTQLQLVGIDYEKRMYELKKNPCGLLSEVSYVYARKNVTDPFLSCIYNRDEWKLVYQNNSVQIWMQIYKILKIK